MAARFGLIPLAIIFASCGSAEGDSKSDGLDSVDHRIFVTSLDYAGDLGGLEGADLKCKSLAEAAGLTREYKAILSTDTEQARDRLNLIGAVYIFDESKNKQEVVSVGLDLWSSQLEVLVELDERGERRISTVWTGTDSDGGNSGASAPNCSGWTSSDAGASGMVGDNQSLFDLWLEEPSSISCDSLKPIYCISQ